MHGIIASFRRRCTCILRSKSFLLTLWVLLVLGLIGFGSILPALAFSLDMFEKTHQSYGVNEVLLASVLGAVVFSLFAAQPLVIVGVTGESKI